MTTESRDSKEHSLRQRIAAVLGWNRASYFLLSVFFATVALIVVVWWPLAEEVLSYLDPTRPLLPQLDWLLIGIFVAMSLLIMGGADWRTDVLIAAVGLAGGLVIEAWGTQTELWTYYTLERPPLWIIPAWPIAFLSIDRLTRLLDALVPRTPRCFFKVSYWLVGAIFFAMLVVFVWPTRTEPLTLLAVLLCALLLVSPRDERLTLLTFLAGVGLGYFLELWGTTRACWTYYTRQTPPLFAVLAHGMAAVAFWRTRLLLLWIGSLIGERVAPARSAR